MSNAVIVIDMLRGFLEESYPLYSGPAARAIIPNILALLAHETERGAAVFFIADNHAPEDLEFKIFPPHCVAGTAETEIVPELARFAADAIITKQRYSGFFETALEASLKKVCPEKLIICGVCTDICVLHTVADARNRDYQVEVPINCVASFDEEAHRWALRHMEKVLGAKLT
ncbi:MAG: cysteine hydrolase [Dehalococcoidia bacterium]|nr:cysteine hydrolase [Dehalococcoidia bacterium]